MTHTAPPPNAAPPITYTRTHLANAITQWSNHVFTTEWGDGFDWEAIRTRCTTKKRCVLIGAWHVDTNPTITVYRFTKCRPNRITTHAIYWTRNGYHARIRINKNGGATCAVRAPYVPAQE